MIFPWNYDDKRRGCCGKNRELIAENSRAVGKDASEKHRMRGDQLQPGPEQRDMAFEIQHLLWI
jgi:hypothetical protein